MEIINSNNIYINIGDNQYMLVKNEYIYEYKKYYFNNNIILKYCNNLYKINLNNQKYFQIKIINLGNYIFIYIYNKMFSIYNLIIKKETDEIYYNDTYNYNTLLKYQVNLLIKILKNKLNNTIKLPKYTLNNLNVKLNNIQNELETLNNQKLLYYKENLKLKFNL